MESLSPIERCNKCLHQSYTHFFFLNFKLRVFSSCFLLRYFSAFQFYLISFYLPFSEFEIHLSHAALKPMLDVAKWEESTFYVYLFILFLRKFSRNSFQFIDFIKFFHRNLWSLITGYWFNHIDVIIMKINHIFTKFKLKKQ